MKQKETFFCNSLAFSVIQRMLAIIFASSAFSKPNLYVWKFLIHILLKHARLICSWDFSGKNTGVGCHFLLQGIFLTQGLTCISYVSYIEDKFFTQQAIREAPNILLKTSINDQEKKQTIEWDIWIQVLVLLWDPENKCLSISKSRSRHQQRDK